MTLDKVTIKIMIPSIKIMQEKSYSQTFQRQEKRLKFQHQFRCNCKKKLKKNSKKNSNHYINYLYIHVTINK